MRVMINLYYKAVVRFIIFVTFLPLLCTLRSAMQMLVVPWSFTFGSWGTFVAHALLILDLSDTAVG